MFISFFLTSRDLIYNPLAFKSKQINLNNLLNSLSRKILNLQEN